MRKNNATHEERARFAAERAESFGDLRELGLIDEATHMWTLRDLRGDESAPSIIPPSGPEIRALRERGDVSQAALAKYLNLSPEHVPKLERGAVPPTGALLAMLNVFRRRGLEAIL
jgi:putative transcriptional regulator